MTPINETSAEKILQDRGLQAFLPLTLVARRPGCDVWSAKLFTPYGDAQAEIQIYPLKANPVSIVDMEEEAGGLDRSASRALVHEARDEEYGILVTSARKDEPIFRRFFTEGIPEKRSVTYHPQLDRILGGDYFHELNGHWLKACLSSKSRAMQMHELLGTVQVAYSKSPHWEGKLDDPFPRVLAILSIPPLELAEAPPEYQELALTQLVIASPEPVQAAPPQDQPAAIAFCRQLFGTVAATHRASLGFSRDAGCCLRPEFLIADGSFSDAYFLSALDNIDDPEEIRLRDLWNALLVTYEFSRGDVAFTSELLKIALVQYTNRKRLQQELIDMVNSAAEELEGGNVIPLTMLLKMNFQIA